MKQIKAKNLENSAERPHANHAEQLEIVRRRGSLSASVHRFSGHQRRAAAVKRAALRRTGRRSRVLFGLDRFEELGLVAGRHRAAADHHGGHFGRQGQHRPVRARARRQRTRRCRGRGRGRLWDRDIIFRARSRTLWRARFRFPKDLCGKELSKDPWNAAHRIRSLKVIHYHVSEINVFVCHICETKSTFSVFGQTRKKERGRYYGSNQQGRQNQSL